MSERHWYLRTTGRFCEDKEEDSGPSDRWFLIDPDRPDPLMQTKMSQKWEEKTHFCQVFKPNIHSPGKGVLFFFWTKLLFGIKPFLRMSGVPRVVEGLRVIQHENTKFHLSPVSQHNLRCSQAELSYLLIYSLHLTLLSPLEKNWV